MENQQSSQLPSQPKNSSLPGIGDLFNRAWQIYKERFWVFVGIIVLPTLIVFGIALFITLQFISISETGQSFFSSTALLFGGPIIILVAIIVNLWAWVALLYAIKESKDKIGIRESFAKGWHKIISYLWISILTGVITLGGFLLLIVPGIIFAVWFSLAKYVLVVENLTGTKALFRSKQLVSGCWWEVLWRFITIGIIAIIISIFIDFVGRLIGVPKNINISSLIISLFFSPFATVYAFIVYEDLKKIKEGVVV
ncbi:MAG: hypothetical protein A2Z78_00220 [Candidatus Nealsonbacteria bacterium RBG_13_36_15]|uniref:Glycerophosphoryl diester phosphodiesterase membrane domain-containing protein n=1 Tax=Candidatus Nealsonbacteria bacterium RBG_13_36_15 TaxID=1801660 RepID=A0A1G2DVY5_9BACT|nr:MAG: hypothetical protein A2Z78_00220 [Candidatus Nealsonbacteria bacterium RBG_13_36_15]